MKTAIKNLNIVKREEDDLFKCELEFKTTVSLNKCKKFIEESDFYQQNDIIYEGEDEDLLTKNEDVKIETGNIDNEIKEEVVVKEENLVKEEEVIEDKAINADEVIKEEVVKMEEVNEELVKVEELAETTTNILENDYETYPVRELVIINNKSKLEQTYQEFFIYGDITNVEINKQEVILLTKYLSLIFFLIFHNY